jgi:hypothetical protein
MSRPLESDDIDLDTGEILQARRTKEQNKRLHAMLDDLSEQATWAGERMDAETWKRLLLGAYYGQTTMPNPLDPQAPFVVVNKMRSRDLVKSRKEKSMADFLSEIQVFGDERGVRWGDGQ